MLSIERQMPRRRPRRERRKRDVRGFFGDQLAVLAVLTLVVLGVLNLYVVGGASLAGHQAVLAVVGLVLMLVLRRVGTRWAGPLGWACYISAILALAAVAAVGVEVSGARRWLALGTVTFQPSELAKLGVVLVLAAVLGSDWAPWRRFGAGFVLAAVPIALTVLEPDLSTTTVLTALVLIMLVLGRIPARFILPLVGSAVIAAPLAVRLLRGYQLARIHDFLTGSHSASSTGWATLQAHIAVGTGGLYGQVHEPLHQLMAAYLPERETDLAFASLVEQWGAVAGGAAVLAVAILLWRLVLASRAASTRGDTLVGAGLAALLGVETVLSLGGNLGLLPIAGVPFPLLSYGGTATVVHLAGVGMVLGIRRRSIRKRLWAPPRSHQPRPRLVRATALGLSILLAGAAAYGWSLQTNHGASLRATGLQEMTRCVTVPAPRGAITDRHGVALAVTPKGRQDVYAFASLVLRHPSELSRLAHLVHHGVPSLRHALGHAKGLDAEVATLSPSAAKRLAAENLPGVWLAATSRRDYPYGSLLGPILGFTGVATPTEVKREPDIGPKESVGRAGLEASYDALLRGIPGKECAYVDPAGKPVAVASHTDPVPGATLRTSLDLGLQRSLSRDLANARGGQGAAVAMDPRTGAVLAMVSRPTYDNSVYGPPIHQKALLHALRRHGSPTLEHATQEAAPPGSTFKLVIASTDLAYGTVPAGQVVPTGGSYTYGGHTFHNWSTLGPMNLTQSIAMSNDVYFYKLAVRLGVNRIVHVAHELGVGRPTGIDLPGESPGYLGTPASVRKAGGYWYGGSTVILGIGQGYLTVTPLQNARWTAGVTTGALPTPQLGLASVTGTTATALPTHTPRRLPFASKLDVVRHGMRQAVTGGTATLLGNLPAAVGAKTGSAQDPSAGGTDSWLTSAVPVNNPHIVMTAFVSRGGEGAKTAGPVVQQGLRYYLAHKKAIQATGPVSSP